MKSDAQTAPALPFAAQTPSRSQLWAGWILSGLTTAFLLMDALVHFFKPAPVLEASQRLGMPLSMSTVIGTIMVIALTLYVNPRTVVLGVILLTGYLGGAISIHLRAGSTFFECVFPLIIAAMAWGGVYLREPRLRSLLPIRK